MNKADTERVLRMAVTSARASQERLRSLPKGEGSLASALESLDDALWHIGDWAELNEYTITESMHT